MRESFAIVLGKNMSNLDEWFAGCTGRMTFATRPDPLRFRPGRALIISQDSHNRVFAVVGYLDQTRLDGAVLSFEAARRFPIPVVLTNADEKTSSLVLEKGYLNAFMYLHPTAEDQVIAEADRLCRRDPIAGS